MGRMGKAMGVSLAAAGCLAGGAAAGDEVLVSSRDNTLYQAFGNEQSNGAGQHFFTGVTFEPSLRRGLLEFDLSSIPADATILECTLTLYMSRTIAAVHDTTLHVAHVHWGEGASDAAGAEGAGADPEPGDATWIHTEYDSEYWTSPGGDFEAAASATAPVGDDGFYSWTSAGMVSDVQAWVSGASPNHGWVVLGDERFPGTAKRFDTREHPEESRRPHLRVVYRPACIADWNSDGAVNTLDFIAFLNEWVAGSIAADLNGDESVNTQDFIAFLNAWNAGC